MGTPELSTEDPIAFQIRELNESKRVSGILVVDGRRVAAANDLFRYLRGLTVGEMVNLTVLRDGERLQLPVTLGTRNLWNTILNRSIPQHLHWT